MEFARIFTLDCNVFGENFNVFVSNGELALVNFDVLIGRILNNDRLTDTFANWTDQLESLHIFVVFDCDGKVIELVLASLLVSERGLEFVETRSQSQKVKFVVFVTFTGNVKHFCAANEQTLTFTFYGPLSRESLCSLVLVLHRYQQILLVLCADRLCDKSLRVGLSSHAEQVVQESSSIGQREEKAALMRHINHVFTFSRLRLFGHRFRLVGDFILSAAFRRHNHRGLSNEIAGYIS